MKLLILATLLVAFCGLSLAADDVHGVEGCYYCLGPDECKDEEKLTSKECVDFPYPDIKYVCITMSTMGEVTRKGCWLQKAIPEGSCNENATTSVCTCDEDYCNSAKSFQSIWWLIGPSFMFLGLFSFTLNH